MECTHCEVCAAAADIYSRGSFTHFALLFRVVTGPFVLFLSVLLALAIIRSNGLVYNVKVLLFAIFCGMSVANLGVVLGAVYNLVTSFVLPEDKRCEYQVDSPKLHEFYQTMVHMGIVLMFFFIVSMTVDCIVATFFKLKPRKWLVPIFVTIKVVVTVSLVLLNSRGRGPALPYPAPELKDTAEYTHGLDTGVLVLIIATAISCGLLWYNRRRQGFSTTADPSEEEEHKEVLSLLLPLLLPFTSMILILQLIARTKMPEVHRDTPMSPELLTKVTEYAPYGEVKSSLFPIVSVLIVALALVASEPIRRSFYTLLRIKTDERATTTRSHPHEVQWHQSEREKVASDAV